jgi:hypothetical protein
MAADYVHWAGRLMRSYIAVSRHDAGHHASDAWSDDFAFCARQVLGAGKVGGNAQQAIERVLTDDLVLEAFKELLRSGNHGLQV